MKRVTVIAMMIFLSSSVLRAQENSVSSLEGEQNSIGFGSGIPYGCLGNPIDNLLSAEGGVGANIDINVLPNLDLSVGVGQRTLTGMGYNLGLQYSLTSIEHTFRPKVSVYYGTNSMAILSGYLDTMEKTYRGFSLGIGAEVNMIAYILDFDIIYVATSGLEVETLRKYYPGRDIEKSGEIRISIGLHVF